jgi:aspartyl-tRNA(Asn)/glutamyl-tRNA(Gln) amidotransferase subunit C
MGSSPDCFHPAIPPPSAIVLEALFADCQARAEMAMWMPWIANSLESRASSLPTDLGLQARFRQIFAPMASPSDIDINYVANLARLALSDAEKETFSRQLGDVLRYIEKLSAVDVSQVEPTAHAFPVSNVWAEDVSQPGLPVEAALKNAPAQRDNMIVVPVVVE